MSVRCITRITVEQQTYIHIRNQEKIRLNIICLALCTFINKGDRYAQPISIICRFLLKGPVVLVILPFLCVLVTCRSSWSPWSLTANVRDSKRTCWLDVRFVSHHTVRHSPKITQYIKIDCPSPAREAFNYTFNSPFFCSAYNLSCWTVHSLTVLTSRASWNSGGGLTDDMSCPLSFRGHYRFIKCCVKMELFSELYNLHMNHIPLLNVCLIKLIEVTPSAVGGQKLSKKEH